ncbi:hypothetical protein REPUB_Repub17cG0117800 [Reevesia pubescens]
MIYPMQMLLAGFITLLLAFPFATSSTISTTSKDEIKCDSCAPVNYTSPPPPPVVIDCPPPPSPPSLPPSPSPPSLPPSPSPPSLPPSPSPPSLPPPPPNPSPPPPTCPGCPPPCSGCLPPCNPCPPAPPPCSACQIPNTTAPPRPEPRDQQPGMMAGAVYSPPNEVVPYFPYDSAASSTHLELKLVFSIIFLSLSVTFSFF